MEPAGFWIRFAAYLIDFFIVMFALGIIGAFMEPVMKLLKDTPLSGKILFQYTLIDILDYILTMVYFVVLTYFTGATLGKKALNLKVVSVEKDGKLKLFNVIYRETIGRYFSDLFGGIGYLAVVFNDEKKAIHDMLGDTKVVKVIKLNPYYAYQQPVPQPVPQSVPQPVPQPAPQSDLQEAVQTESQPVPQMMPQQPLEGQSKIMYEYTTVQPLEENKDSQEEITRQWERVLNPQKEENTEGDS